MRETQAHWPRPIGSFQYEARGVDLKLLYNHPRSPPLCGRNQPASGSQKATRQGSARSAVAVYLKQSTQSKALDLLFFGFHYPSSFQGNRSAAQLGVAMTASAGVAWAFIPSSRRNLAHKKSDTVSQVSCSA